MDVIALESRTSPRRWLVWVAVAVITITSVAGIRTLLRWCNESHRVVELLNRLEGEVNYLSALEWESMARKAVSEEARELQFSTQQEIAQVLGDLEPSDRHWRYDRGASISIRPMSAIVKNSSGLSN